MMRKEKGFTLLTLAVTIGITAMIAAGAGMTVMHIFRGTERNENQTEVVRQAQNLGRWFGRDALMAENITAGDNPGTGDDEFVSMFWKDWETGNTYNITYKWFDDADSLKLIKRNQIMRDKNGAVVSDVTSLIANSIYTANIPSRLIPVP